MPHAKRRVIRYSCRAVIVVTAAGMLDATSLFAQDAASTPADLEARARSIHERVITKLILTQTAPRRPFQGWRYLAADDTPKDLPKMREGDDDLPADLMAELAEIGIL